MPEPSTPQPAAQPTEGIIERNGAISIVGWLSIVAGVIVLAVAFIPFAANKRDWPDPALLAVGCGAALSGVALIGLDHRLADLQQELRKLRGVQQ